MFLQSSDKRCILLDIEDPQISQAFSGTSANSGICGFFFTLAEVSAVTWSQHRCTELTQRLWSGRMQFICLSYLSNLGSERRGGIYKRLRAKSTQQRLLAEKESMARSVFLCSMFCRERINSLCSMFCMREIVSASSRIVLEKNRIREQREVKQERRFSA